MLTYDLSHIPNYGQVCFVHLTREAVLEAHGSVEGWDLEPGGSYTRLSSFTKALIDSTPHVGLNEITHDCLEEFQYRLDLLYDSEVPFLFSTHTEGMVPIPIIRRDIHRHIGLKTSAQPMSNEGFDALIRIIRLNRQRVRNAGAPP